MRVCVARTTAWDGVGGIRGSLTSPCRTALTKMEDSGERVTVGYFSRGGGCLAALLPTQGGICCLHE